MTGSDFPAVATEPEGPPQTKRIVRRDLIVIGTSAGGVQTLQQLIADLPPELPASVLVVLHLMTAATSVLDDILSRAGGLTVTRAADGEPLERGHVYVAPPDHHLLVLGNRIGLGSGPRENGHRPAIDLLFRSAARAYGPRVVGVVLSGTLDDGTDGLRLIKERGGATVCQDPDDAAFGEMPKSAIDFVGPDRVVPLAQMGHTIRELVDTPLKQGDFAAAADQGQQPADRAEVDSLSRHGDASLLTCPDCGGVLMESEEGGIVRFACQVGHAYSPDSLVEQQADALESALWQALRTMEERADLLARMAKRAERRGLGSTGTRMERRAEVVTGHAAAIRNTILRLRNGEAADPVAPRPAR